MATFWTAVFTAVSDYAEAGSITSTFDPPSGQFAWSEPTNWDHVPPAPGVYPKNGQGGNTFDVRINLDRADLSEDITIDSLGLNVDATGQAAEILAGGKTLTVVNTTTSVASVLSGGGTFTLNTLVVPGGLTVADAGTIVSATTTTLGVAGGADGTLTLENGGQFTNAGSFSLLDDGSIALGNGSGSFFNNGNFSKNGGTMSSSVTATFQDQGAGNITNLSTGTLRFSGPTTLTNSNIVVNSGGLTVFGGISTINGAALTITNSSEFYFEGGTHTLTGTVTSTGDGTGTVIAKGATSINGGTLNCADNAPFSVESAFLGTLSQIKNTGAFRWKGGTIRGSGVRNDAATAGQFTITGTTAAVRVIENGALQNFKHLTAEASSVQIGTDGILRNETGGTFAITGAAVFDRKSGTANGLVENAGMLIASGGAAASIFTDFKNAAAASIQINGGSLSLRNTTTLAGNIGVDRSTDALAKLTIAGQGLSVANCTLNSPAFTLNAAATSTPLVEFGSGTHTLNGSLALSGSGTLEQRGASVLVVPAGGGSIVTSAGTRFLLNSTTASLSLAGPLTNNGNFDWQNGTVMGASPFINLGPGTITVLNSGTTTISDGTSGRLENSGRLTVQSNNTLRLKNGGTLVNRAALANPLELLGNNSNINKESGATTDSFANEGALIKDGSGTSTITANYTQNAGAFVEARSGTLLFSGAYQFPAGVFSAQGATSLIRVTGSGTLSSLTFDLGAGGTFEFDTGATPATHTVTGNLTGTGTGTAKLTGGTLTSTAGNTGRINFANSARFQQTGGLLGSNGTIENRGLYFMTGGMTDGMVRNVVDATFTQQGGVIDGTFTNAGLYDWQSGAIAGNFLNGDGGFGGMELNGVDTKTLDTDATLQNRNSVTHRSTGEMSLKSNATLRNDAGKVYEFTAGGSISPATGATGVAFINSGELRKSGPDTAFIATPYEQLSGAKIDVASGGITITGNVNITGGSFKAGNSGSLNIRRGIINGNIGHEFAFGKVQYEASGPLSFSGSLSSSGNGGVFFTGNFSIAGNTTFSFANGAMGRITGSTVTLGGQLTTEKGLQLDGATIRAGNTDRFRNISSVDPVGVEIIGTAATTFDATGTGEAFLNDATLTISGSGGLRLDRTARLRNNREFIISSDADVLRGSSATDARFVNTGVLKKDGPGVSVIGVPFSNPLAVFGTSSAGKVIVLQGTLQFTGGIDEFSGGTLGGGSWTVQGSGTLTLGTDKITQIAAETKVELHSFGKITNLPTVLDFFLFENNGSLTLKDGASIKTAGELENNGYLFVDGTSSIDANPFDNDGTLEGSGTINGKVINNGTATPNKTDTKTPNAVAWQPRLGQGRAPAALLNEPSTLTIAGDYTQTSQGVLEIHVYGTGSDQLVVKGTATIDGTVRLIFMDGYAPVAGEVFKVIDAAQLQGAFASFEIQNVSGFQFTLVTNSDGDLIIKSLSDAVSSPASVQTGRPQSPNALLLNLATRLGVQTGDNVLIGGFIITGSENKKVIVRGIGPSLSSLFTNVLANPTLDLFQGNALLRSNDDWKSDQEAEIINTGIPPTNDLESAIVATLAPGAYTAILRGLGSATGIGLVEIYDLDQPANSTLANIATRGFVDTNNNVMIGGLIVGPAAGLNIRVVVRAIGPTLSNAGINGVLLDPTVELVNASGTVIRANDNWKLGGQEAELTSLALQPGDDRESALVEIVAPGPYTAIVRGKGNTTGVSLVEVYNVP